MPGNNGTNGSAANGVKVNGASSKEDKPPHLSPIQLKMLALFSDGMGHSKQELHACLWDDQGAITNIKAHITMIRKVLRPKGEDILIEFKNNKIFYRHVRLLPSAYNGHYEPMYSLNG